MTEYIKIFLGKFNNKSKKNKSYETEITISDSYWCRISRSYRSLIDIEGKSKC